MRLKIHNLSNKNLFILLQGELFMSFYTGDARIMQLTYRINLMKARGEKDRWKLIKALERKRRKLLEGDTNGEV